MKDGGTRGIINFVKSNRIENIDVNLIWTSLLIINVIPLPPSLPLSLHPQHFNWTIILPQSPAKNTAVRSLQVHGCLNKTQPNSRKSRDEGGESNRAGKAGWHWAPNICHLWSPLRLASPHIVSSPLLAFLAFLSQSGELGAEYSRSNGLSPVWGDWKVWSQQLLLFLPDPGPDDSQPGRPDWQCRVKLITENIRHFN